jgi:hypothetical protein
MLSKQMHKDYQCLIFNQTDLDYNHLNNYTVDPRLYHTVALPGLPWKYDSNETYKESWNRKPGVYGYYAL